MYVLIPRELLPSEKFYETVPDGRCIVPMNEVKGMSLVGVDIVPSAQEMKKVIERQKIQLSDTPTVIPELGDEAKVEQTDKQEPAVDGTQTESDSMPPQEDKDQSDGDTIQVESDTIQKEGDTNQKEGDSV